MSESISVCNACAQKDHCNKLHEGIISCTGLIPLFFVKTEKEVK